jgi:hypothetical protein
MFIYDERIRGIPAAREQVVSIHTSLNRPHLAIPGKQAGPAQAFVVSLRGQSGFAVFVYLYLAESSDSAVYLSQRRKLSQAELPAEESDALSFVESMGFIMDNLNFAQLPMSEQDGVVRTMPVFFKDPKAVPKASGGPAPAKQADPARALGRLFSSF